MIAATIILGAFVLIAHALTVRHHADRVIRRIDAAELRQVVRERNRGLDANVAARWVD